MVHALWVMTPVSNHAPMPSVLFDSKSGSDLWCHVLYSADRTDGHFLLHAHGQPEVSQLHPPICANEDVF